jgi:adenylyltransferase/sulfurtransferase
MIQEITPQEFVERRAAGTDMTLLDVREAWELELAPVPSPLVHIPMGQIADRFGELDPNKETVVICRSGGRSLEVARFLSAQGFASVANLSGGILKWSRDLDSNIPQY